MRIEISVAQIFVWVVAPLAVLSFVTWATWSAFADQVVQPSPPEIALEEPVVPAAVEVVETAIEPETEVVAPEPEPEPIVQVVMSPDDALGPPDHAIGLAGVADWSAQQPFIDVMKTARPWIGHETGQWGGLTESDLREQGVLDENGWPIEIPSNLWGIGTVILTDLPSDSSSLAGRYRLTFEGEGEVQIEGRTENVTYADGMVEFDYTPGPGAVTLSITRSNGESGEGYVRNIEIVKTDYLEAYERGEIFNPQWIERITGFGVIRLMDWMDTNDSLIAEWSDRPEVGDYTYARNGVPAEVLIDLANTIAADPWFNMPHLASDDFITRFAELTRDRLNGSLTAYVEYSNEVWNWQFQQAVWADEQAEARWQVDYAWMQFYGMRTGEMANIWNSVFEGQPDDRLVTVISTQTAWRGLEIDVLTAPLWVAEDPENNRPPFEMVETYAVSGYFGHVLGTDKRIDTVRSWIADSQRVAERRAVADGLSGADRDAYIAEHRYDEAIALAANELRDGSVTGEPEDTITGLVDTFGFHANVAAEHGLEMIMYEGGTHVVGLAEYVEDEELTSFFTALNYSDEMGELYAELMTGWRESGGKLFNAYVDVLSPSKWGSWGALRSLDDNNPRWEALTAWHKR